VAYHFTFLDNVALADAAFEAHADTPSELLAAAGQAVIETMVDPRTVEPVWSKTIELQAPDLASLLFDWLAEIVYLKDAEGVVFREAKAVVSEDRPHGGWKVRGMVTGESIDPERHDLRADVKAVTKHLFQVQQADERWLARVVLDI
jgi:SHS2 domain-containing protein